MKRTLSILFIGSFFFGMSQNTDALPKLENELAQKFAELRQEEMDQEKIYASEQIVQYIQSNADQPGIMDYNFLKLKTVSTIKSPDGKFRIFNWNVEMKDLSHKYYCVMVKEKGNNKYDIIDFNDRSQQVFEPHPQKTFTSSNWFGCLYYKVIPIKKGAKTIYTMLAYDGNNDRSNIKFVEGMIFSGKKVKLGVPILETKDGVLKRYFLEHSEKTIISLNYDPQRNMIIMDHLVPENEKLAGMYEFYVPCFSYDGFRLEKGKWVLEEDVIAVNKPQGNKMRVQVSENKYITIKNKWEDPTSDGSSGTHKAVTPEMVEKQNKKNSRKKDRKLKFKKARYLNNRNNNSILYQK